VRQVGGGHWLGEVRYEESVYLYSDKFSIISYSKYG